MTCQPRRCTASRKGGKKKGINDYHEHASSRRKEEQGEKKRRMDFYLVEWGEKRLVLRRSFLQHEREKKKERTGAFHAESKRRWKKKKSQDRPVTLFLYGGGIETLVNNFCVLTTEGAYREGRKGEKIVQGRRPQFGTTQRSRYLKVKEEGRKKPSLEKGGKVP